MGRDLERYVCQGCGAVYDRKIAGQQDYICCSLEKETLKRFTIPVIWQVYGTMEIEAFNLEEAEEKARGMTPLPTEKCYVEGSFELDKDNTNYGLYYDYVSGEIHIPKENN